MNSYMVSQVPQDHCKPDQSVDADASWSMLRRAVLESTRALVAAVEAKDKYTQQHSLTVKMYSRWIAQAMGLGEDAIESLETAALLHDIGKIGIPDAILTKPGPLTAEEYEIVKRHPRIGVDILSHSSHLQRELPLILHHHERVDGRGYPDGLEGDAIPLGARILNVADSLDAMLSQRSYRKPLTLEQAREELRRNRGSQFDAEVVDATMQWLPTAISPSELIGTP